MKNNLNKTTLAKASEVKKNYYLIDAKDKILGRVATKAASILRGKHKAIYTPNIDTGDYVVIINAGKLRVTGKKLSDKIYLRFSGYPSGLKAIPLEKMMERSPERVMRLAVDRMIPKGPLGYYTRGKLKIYVGDKHPHISQKPEVLTV